MRICLLAQHYAPHFEGGTEVVVRAQARALAARGHEVRVISGTDRPHSGADVERGAVDGIAVAHIFRRADEGYDFDLVRPRLERLLEEELCAAAPDLVHVHHWSTLSSRLVRPISADGPRVAVTLHDHFASCARFFRTPPDLAIECPPPGEIEACIACCRPETGGWEDARLRAVLARRLEAFRAELAAAGALLAPSRSHARAVESLAGLAPGSVRVVENGLCRELDRPARAARRAGGPLSVLHFGHRLAAKGTLDLVRALAALPPGTARLVLAGAEVERGFDARLRAAAGVLPLDLRGPYDRAALAALAAEADLAAFPSRAPESYGLVVDEALALGLPVWVSDRGALPERVGEAGRVLPAGDVAAWTNALRQACDEPELLARQRAAVPTALRTAADAARELEAIYAELLERPTTVRP